MRAILSVLPVALLAAANTPAMAQDAAPADEATDASDIAATLRDPQVQATATATAAILGEVLLDLPVGPLVQAMDEAVDRLAEETGTEAPARTEVAPDATLRDMLGPKGDKVATELATRVPQAMDAAADMAGAVEEMRPALEELGERMKRALPARLPVPRRD